MKRAIPRLLVLSLILLAGLGFSSIMPVHAQGDFTLTNKVVVNWAVSSNLGIPNGGILKGQITATNLISGTDNSILFSYTLNSTSPDLPIVTFFPNPVPLSSTVDAANTTMTITVNENVLHGAYRLTVNGTSGACPLTCFTHLLTYDIKVYSIGVTIDAQSANPTDITPVLSASQAVSFRVGVMVANATNSGGTNPKCSV